MSSTDKSAGGPGMKAFYKLVDGIEYECFICGEPATHWVEHGNLKRDYCEKDFQKYGDIRRDKETSRAALERLLKLVRR